MLATKKQRLLSPFVRAKPPSVEVIEDTETLPSSSLSSTSKEMGHHDVNNTRKFYHVGNICSHGLKLKIVNAMKRP